MLLKRNNILNFGIVLLLIHFYISISDIVNVNAFVEQIILFSGLFCLVVSSYLKKDKKIIIKTVIYIIAIISYFLSKQSDFLQCLIMIISFQDEDKKRILNIIFKFSVIVLLIHIIVYFIIFAYNSALLHFNIRNKIGSIEIRHTFLFSHSNIFSALLCWTYLLFLYLKKNKNILFNMLLFTAVMSLILFFSKTRTVIIVILSVMILLYLYKKYKFVFVKKIIKYSVPIIGVIFTFFVFLYPTNNMVKNIDSILEARIKLGYVAKELYGISIFGNQISYASSEKYWAYELSSNGFTLDSTYYKVLFSNGILCFLISILYFINIAKKTDYNDEKNCYIFGYALFAAVESFGLYPLLVFPLILGAEKND